MLMWTKSFALVTRALRVDARLARYHLVRFALAASVLMSLASTQATQAMFGAPGRQLFQGLMTTLALFITFAGPMLFGSAVAEEKEERTLGLLKMAGVGPLTLLTGKSVPRFLSLLFILCVQFPFTLLAVTLGGVTPGQILAAHLALVGYITLVAGLALLGSVISRTTSNAIGFALILLIAYFTAPLICEGVGTQMVREGIFPALGQMLQDFSGLLNRTNIWIRLSVVMTSGFDSALVDFQFWSNLLIGCMCAVVSWLLFERFTQHLETIAPKPTRWRLKRRNGQNTARPRVWNRAIPWKDFHYLAGGKRMLVGKFIGYGALILGAAYLIADGRWNRIDSEVIGGFSAGLMAYLVIPIEIVLIGSRIFQVEIKQQTWSTLASLPMSIPQVALSKVGGCLVSLAPAFTYMIGGLLLYPDPLEWLFEAFLDDPISFLMVTGNIIGQYLLLLHLVVWLSLLINNWGGLVVAFVIWYFGNTFVMTLAALFFTFSMGGGNLPDEFWQALGIMASFVELAIVAALIYAIGRILQNKLGQ